MIKKILSLLLFIVSVSFPKDIFDNSFDYFFKPRPIINYNLSLFNDTNKHQYYLQLNNPKLSLLTIPNTAIWEFKPTVQIPAFKINQSSNPNTVLDCALFNSIGGGLTYQRSIIKDSTNYSSISFSTIVLFSDQSIPTEPLNLSLAFTVGGFNNLLQAGLGYDFGTYIGKSRLFFLLSAGINITQN